MTDDVVERARTAIEALTAAWASSGCNDFGQTAQVIIDLLTEIERLRGEPHAPNMASAADLFAENERLRADDKEAAALYVKMRDRAERAEAENARLRAAMSAAKEHAADATKALLAEVALWRGRTERAEAALATAQDALSRARGALLGCGIGINNAVTKAVAEIDAAATGRGG